jgi:hypothetical protein
MAVGFVAAQLPSYAVSFPARRILAFDRRNNGTIFPDDCTMTLLLREATKKSLASVSAPSGILHL